MGVQICYIDESGDTRPLRRGDSTAPVCVIVGVIFEQAVLSLRRFFSILFYRHKKPGK